ncbi:class I SAM-dependent methyltransferase [Flavobacteriaceae bacterium]|nr:class I SAM-dependent methyltransferase [Flavobacteriaceae bacterium]
MITGGRGTKIFEEYLRLTIENSDLILDIGTSERFAKELRPYKDWFTGKNYLAGGYNPKNNFGEYNCDLHIDIENIPYEDNTVDSIICIEVLEHVRNPFKAIDEIYRTLKPGGKVFFTTPFLLGYHGKTKKQNSIKHDHDEYPDYFRFTHQGLELLFQYFSEVNIEVLNGPVEMLMTNARLFKLLNYKMIRKVVDIIDFPKVTKQTTRHLVYAIK